MPDKIAPINVRIITEIISTEFNAEPSSFCHILILEITPYDIQNQIDVVIKLLEYLK